MSLARECTRLIAAIAITVASIGAAVAQAPKPMTIVVHEAGSAWKVGKAAQEQDLGPHFGYVGEQFKAGRVVAYGTQADAIRGYYVLNTADTAEIKAFVDNDPGVKSQVLKHTDTLGWGVLINGFAANKKDEGFYLLRYAPGRNWVKGKPLTEQNIKHHFGYITDLAQTGVVVAGGPRVGADEGFYVIRAKDKSAADAFIAADPGVTSGIFRPVALGWTVIAMQPAK
jgi:uncharacterized protein YciI